MELLARHGIPLQSLSDGRPHLGLAQGELGLAIAPFGPRLRGQRAAVALKVKLTHVTRRRDAALDQVIEVSLWRRHAREGHPLQVSAPRQVLEVVTGGSSATVAPSKGYQAGRDIILLHALPPALDQ